MSRWWRHDPEPGFEPVSTTFRGFRIWRAETPDRSPDLRLLRSIAHTGYGWEPGVNTAVCHARPSDPHGGPLGAHRAPAEDCMCGFWALTGPGYHRLGVPGFLVCGIVEAWGRMVIGPKGFRAEKARIVALCFPSDPMQTLDAGNGERLADSLLGYPWVRVLPFRDPGRLHPTTPELQALIRRVYGPVPVFEESDAMQAAFPLTDTTALIDDSDGPEAA